jgi:hypothetical protein
MDKPTERTPAEEFDPDEAWYAQLGAEHADEEKITRRLSLADRLRQRAARIGRRPRP